MTAQAALEIWREGNAAALEAVGYVMDADLCRRGQFDLMPSAKAFQEVIAKAIEARSGQTQGLDPKGESAVAESHLPETSENHP